MKQTPYRIKADTLGDLISLRNEGMIGGLEAWCYRRDCSVVSVKLDIDALARERGHGFEWKRLKGICSECKTTDTSISLLWTHTKHITFQHHGSRTPTGV